jgi:hypothetical protein
MAGHGPGDFPNRKTAGQTVSGGGHRTMRARRSVKSGRSDQRRLIQGKYRLIRRQRREPGNVEPHSAGQQQALPRHFHPCQRCHMAAAVGVMLVRTRRAIRRVMIIIARIVTVVVIAALGGLTLRVHMIQREHTATQSGDHAEHHEPRKHASHADQKTPIFNHGKPIFSVSPAGPRTSRGSK